MHTWIVEGLILIKDGCIVEAETRDEAEIKALNMLKRIHEKPGALKGAEPISYRIVSSRIDDEHWSSRS